MTIAEYPHRRFQLWEFRVSHGCALVRSPRGPDIDNNIDILLFGVEYLSLPTLMRGLVVEKGTAEEQQRLSDLLAMPLEHEKVWALTSGRVRHRVVAVELEVRETDTDIFESPFADM